MMDNLALAQAQELIRDGCYYEARQLLEELDDPDARQMLRHLDMVGVMVEKPKRLSQLLPPDEPEKNKRAQVEANVFAQDAFAQNIESGPVVVVNTPQQPSLLVQGVWFLFVGWWASQLAILTAYLLILSIVGMPLGVMILNRLPGIVALRGPKKELTVRQVNGTTFISHEQRPQYKFWIRAVYFLLCGWWLGLLLVEISWVFMLTLIGLPVAVLIYDYIPRVVSLRR